MVSSQFGSASTREWDCRKKFNHTLTFLLSQQDLWNSVLMSSGPRYGRRLTGSISVLEGTPEFDPGLADSKHILITGAMDGLRDREAQLSDAHAEFGQKDQALRCRLVKQKSRCQRRLLISRPCTMVRRVPARPRSLHNHAFRQGKWPSKSHRIHLRSQHHHSTCRLPPGPEPQ